MPSPAPDEPAFAPATSPKPARSTPSRPATPSRPVTPSFAGEPAQAASLARAHAREQEVRDRIAAKRRQLEELRADFERSTSR